MEVCVIQIVKVYNLHTSILSFDSCVCIVKFDYDWIHDNDAICVLFAVHEESREIFAENTEYLSAHEQRIK